MSKSAIVQARVDSQIKSEAKHVLDELNISLSEAIALYLKQIIFHKGIPFAVKIPNKLTAETLAKSEQGQEIHKVSDVDELFAELDR